MRDVVGGGFIGVNGGATLSDPTADHRHQVDFVGDHERQSAPAALGGSNRRSGPCRSGSRSRQHRSRELARPEGGSARPASESDDQGESHLFLRSVPLSIGCDTEVFPWVDGCRFKGDLGVGFHNAPRSFPSVSQSYPTDIGCRVSEKMRLRYWQYQLDGLRHVRKDETYRSEEGRLSRRKFRKKETI